MKIAGRTVTRRLPIIVVALVVLAYGALLLYQAETIAVPVESFGPKPLNEAGTIVFPSFVPIVNITAKLRTYDAWAAYNPINVSFKVYFGDIQEGTKVAFVLVPTSFNDSELGKGVPVSTFLAVEGLSGNLINFTQPRLVFPHSIVDVSETISSPLSGDFTMLAIIQPATGPSLIGMPSTKLMTLGTYSEYSQVVANRLTAQIAGGVAAQDRSGDIMEALTWILVAFTLFTILLESRQR